MYYIYREKLKSEQKNREFLSSLEMKDRQIASLQSVSAGGYVYQHGVPFVSKLYINFECNILIAGIIL